jgi:hypothetical protein
MTIGERKECDERECAMWNRGFKIGAILGGLFGLALGAAFVGAKILFF